MIKELLKVHELYLTTDDKRIKALLLSTARRMFDLSFEVRDNRLTKDEVYAGVNVSKISAVKAYRDRTKEDLSSCIKIVTQYFNDNKLEFKNKERIM